MIEKIRNWWIKLAVKYQNQIGKNKYLTRCAGCKKKYLFDVPAGVIVDEVDFICGKCVKKEKENLK